MKSLRALFIGVAKDAQPVKFSGANEFAKLLEIALAFAGKSNDERCSQSEAWNRAAHLLDGLEKNIGIAAALHALEHRRCCVLQRHVNVGADFRMRGYRIEQAAGNFVGIGVKKAHPTQ